MDLLMSQVMALCGPPIALSCEIVVTGSRAYFTSSSEPTYKSKNVMPRARQNSLDALVFSKVRDHAVSILGMSSADHWSNSGQMLILFLRMSLMRRRAKASAK